MTHAEQEERVKELTAKLEQGVTEFFDSDRFKSYLDFIAKFHRYSARNSLLILLQCPEASLVAGYQAWKTKFKRNVRQGEHGILIFAPSPLRLKKEQESTDPLTGQTVTEEVTVEIPKFRTAYVFDVSQTDGPALPELVSELTGDVEQYESLTRALFEISPVPVDFKEIDGNAKGYYHQLERKIYLRTGMSEAQTLKTLVHEIAHAELHAMPIENGKIVGNPEKDRHTREVEAESIAYVVCQRLGIDTADYSFGYVASWSKDRTTSELQSSLELIGDTAMEIINALAQRCPDLFPECQKEEAQEKKPKQKKRKRVPIR